ncbi:MFS transporter [Limosilactobacillus sp. STM2_1]|uniref:MFS transporter n=1 Tax=Limosilactobacillus rudii TaxID=2759755 RepID=A0A7W3UMN9_9LACO|nr:MFS transporter [Limosilactobacillus rudii]MBB1080367.1 MFS transporter [Limosilactobacillus rudii]MBB1098393.1 MFS transporter [Limosilactobacillus rudii]MCD7135401.1 MFS transporter [Limosilactobacillus rudii]
MTDKISPRVIAAIIATGLMSFCGVIVETAMNVTFPILMQEFTITTNTVQWITSIYLLLVAIFVPLSAILKSSFTTKRLFTVAILLFISGVVIDAVAPTFPVLLIGRGIQGVGTGIALPLMFNIIMEQVPSSKIGLMMGVGNLITGVAPAIGPTFGGVVASQLNWRWVFYLLLPLLIISLLLGEWGIIQKSVIRRQHVDLFSMLMIICLFTGLVTGFSNLGSQPFVSLRVGGCLLVGLIGMVGLVWRSLIISKPILQLRLFKNLSFTGHVLGFFLTQIISLGFAFLLPNYIQIVNGSTAMVAGLVVLPAGFAGAIFAPLGGRILDRFGARKPILIGITLCLLSLLLFTLMSRSLSNSFIAVVYIFYMAGMGMCMGSVMTNALAVIGKENTLQGNAILNTLQQFAGAIGTSLVAMIVAASQAHLHISRSNSTAIGTQKAFTLLTFLAITVWISYYYSVKKSK